MRILLQRTEDPKTGKERMHLDLETDDVEAEVQRLEALGATRWDHQQERGYDFWVLRDPWAQRVLRPPGQLPRPPRPAPTLADAEHGLTTPLPGGLTGLRFIQTVAAD